MGGGYGKEGDPIYTLTTIKDFIPGVLYMEFYENHPNDSRVNGPYEICPTLSGRMGTGGGNTPLVRGGANGDERRIHSKTNHSYGV